MFNANKTANFNGKKKFLRFFPKGFQDKKYYAFERTYKWEAHKHWKKVLNRPIYEDLLKQKKFDEICTLVIKVESKTHLLFSFEKMAIRDALKTPVAQRLFAEGLFEFIYGSGEILNRFMKWANIIAQLPRKQTRVLTWPILTIFGFLAHPNKFIYFKPQVTRKAASMYDFDLFYKSPPSAETYHSFLNFVSFIRKAVKDMRPKDFIDIQSFIWVQGSSEYDE